ncbi:50S ribosomal protein L25 [candidate division KSB1 bacterium]|nr:50S ribosomal protein L25 [candidate division KSB1 bacterium]
MAEAVLKVENREKMTKSGMKNLRLTGKIPGVYYTDGKDAIPIIIDIKDFYQLFTHKVNIFDLDFDKGEKKPSIVREIQRDPVSGDIIHVDLYGIKATEKIVIKVPIMIIGTPMGVKEMGGILEHPLRELEIQCMPKDVPDSVDIDVSGLELQESIRAEDLTLDKIEIISDPKTLIAHVVPPKVEQEVTIEEELVAAEAEEEEEEGPEVITAKEEPKKEK